MIRRAVAFGALAVMLSLAVAPASESRPVGPRSDRRVLLVTVPGLTWKDIEVTDLPNLRALLEESAVANLATRVTRVVAEPGEAYLTLGAGTRAVAPKQYAGLAFNADEGFGPGSAGEEHARQQGVTTEAEVVSLSWAILADENEAAEYGGEIGALGQALADAGVHRGVVANADGADPLVPGEPIHREAVLALADEVGAVPCGQVSTVLLASDDAAPFGVRLDLDGVVAAADRCRTPSSVVLVEASDLRRALAFKARSTDDLAEAAREQALKRTDELVGRLLEGVDPQRDAVLVLAPSTQPAPGLGVLGIRARELSPGFLTSASTRREGYVLITDIAPTIAELVGVDLDEASIEGRSAEASSSRRSAADRIDALVDGEAAGLFRDDLLDPVVLTVVIAVSALALAAGIGCVRGWSVLRPWLEVASLWLLAFPPMTYLAALLPFHDWGMAAYWAFVVVGAALAAAVASSLRDRWLRPLALLYGLTVLVVVLSVVALGSRLQVATVFGDSPIVAGRVTGINNVTFAFFFLSGSMLACMAVQHWSGERGRQVMLGVLAGVLLVDVAPMWGADVGGALAGLPALLLLATLLGRWKIRWRTVVLAVVGTAALIAVLAYVDLSRDAADRSHLGRLFERIGSDGTSGLTTVVERKLTVNIRSLTDSSWRFLLGPVAIAIGLVAWRGRARAAAVAAAFPPLRWAMPGLIALAVLGYGANDSGIAVPAAMLALAVPGFVYLACRIEPGEVAP